MEFFIPSDEKEQDEILASLSFEEAMFHLEAIIKRLDEGKIPLKDAIQTFEWGSKLRKVCQKMLDEAVLRIEKVQTTTQD
jgi:exodeoxyribonuclease VII small subunit